MVLRPRNVLSLCAGAGGLDMGLMLAEPDAHTRCFVEWDEPARERIIAAQRAGYFAPAPIWDDVTTFDGHQFKGAIDTILAGYPCQPFSHAGQRRGEDDERHLWPHIARIIREIEPEWAFLENVAGHVSLGAETVLRELREMGYTPASGLFSAAEVGAPHKRQRWFCVAHKPGRRRGVGRDAARTGCSGHIDSRYSDMAQPAGKGFQIGGQPRQSETGAQSGAGLVAEPQRSGGNGKLADTNGGNPGSERQQRGREQRFQPEGGRAGAVDVDDARCAERGSRTAEGHQPDRQAQGRIKSASGAEQSGQHVDNAASPRCDPAGIRAGSDIEGGERLSGEGRDKLADARQPGPQGREQPGSPHQRDRALASGPITERSGLPLFPPGPAAADQWGEILRSARHMAPSASLRDCFTWARDLEADGREWWEAQAEPEFRQLLDGLADRTQPLRILGNGVVSLAAAYAWRSLGTAHGLGPLGMGTAGRPKASDPIKPIWGEIA